MYLGVMVAYFFCIVFFFFFKQKTAYEMRISDWSSDVCSSDLPFPGGDIVAGARTMDRIFTNVATSSARLMGQPHAFILSTLLIMLWAVSGPFLHYSETWQLIVNIASSL